VRRYMKCMKFFLPNGFTVSHFYFSGFGAFIRTGVLIFWSWLCFTANCRRFYRLKVEADCRLIDSSFGYLKLSR